MSKVRINDLARELEVKSKSILDALTAVGVTEKKTHSSSIEEHEAEQVRGYLTRGARPASPARPAAEARPAFNLSHVSKPGDALKAILERKQSEAAARSRPPAATSRPTVAAPAAAAAARPSPAARPTAPAAPAAPAASAAPAQPAAAPQAPAPRRIVPQPRAAAPIVTPRPGSPASSLAGMARPAVVRPAGAPVAGPPPPPPPRAPPPPPPPPTRPTRGRLHAASYPGRRQAFGSSVGPCSGRCRRSCCFSGACLPRGDRDRS